MQNLPLYITLLLILVYFVIRLKKPQFKNPMFAGSVIIFIGGFSILTMLLVFAILAFLAFNLRLNEINESIWLEMFFEMKFDILLFIMIGVFSVLLIHAGIKIIKSEKLNKYL